MTPEQERALVNAVVRYRTIVADPPWHYPFGHPAREHKEHPYSTMTIGELCELPVQDWADRINVAPGMDRCMHCGSEVVDLNPEASRHGDHE